jgi:hypothetical protein
MLNRLALIGLLAAAAEPGSAGREPTPLSEARWAAPR